jgi:hypothetical protein
MIKGLLIIAGCCVLVWACLGILVFAVKVAIAIVFIRVVWGLVTLGALWLVKVEEERKRAKADKAAAPSEPPPAC